MQHKRVANDKSKFTDEEDVTAVELLNYKTREDEKSVSEVSALNRNKYGGSQALVINELKSFAEETMNQGGANTGNNQAETGSTRVNRNLGTETFLCLLDFEHVCILSLTMLGINGGIRCLRE
jgi:hypothetical protein